MIESGPFWLSAIARRGRPVDHLGLLDPGLRMADAMLPGVTNTTERARNYTLAAWITRSASDKAELRRLETAFVHAVHNHAHMESAETRGVIGIDSGIVCGPAGIELEKHPKVSVLDAANYGPSSFRLGAVGRSPRGYGPSDDPVAAALADEVSVSGGVIRRIKKGLITREGIEELSSLCFCQPPRPGEREALTELLFRLSPRTGPGLETRLDRPRRETLTLLLLYLELGLSSSEEIVNDLEAWVRGLGKHAKIPEALQPVARGMAVLGLRGAFKRCLEALWCCVIRDAWMRNLGVVRHKDLINRALGVSLEDVPEGLGSRDMAVIARKALEQPIKPASIHQRIRRLVRDNQVERAVAIALDRLLRISVVVTSLQKSEDPVPEFFSLGKGERVALAQFASDMETFSDLRAWADHVVRRYCIRQHLLTAAGKWREGAADGFFMHPSEFGIEAIPEARELLPAGSPTKIDAMLMLLHDIGVSKTSDGSHALTDFGMEVRARSMPVIESMQSTGDLS